MFELTSEPIVPKIADDVNSGGIVTFEGRVRKMNEGHVVERLDYEAFTELAVAEGEKLLEEAKQKFGLDWVHAVHRVGTLELGEVAVWIGCGAAHRKEAFLACEFVIDELKKRLPIWKKEHYPSGASEWINLQSFSSENHSAAELYSRQLVLPEVGASGQSALQATRVLVVGAGGLGTAALPYLAGAGIGRIGIVEPDLLELSNLHRQPIYRFEDVGRSKARLAAEFVRQMHPHVSVEVHEERLKPENAWRLIESYDIVVDGTDNFAAKFLMNDLCQELGKALVQASIYRFEGQIQTILPGGPCMRCLWPVAPVDGCVDTCANSGVLGVVPGIFGILQANEVLKLVLGHGEPLHRTQWLIDLASGHTVTLSREPKPKCPCCSGTPRTWTPIKNRFDFEVTREKLAAWQEPFVVIDVREVDELRQQLDLGQARWEEAPLSSFDPKKLLSDGTRTVLICASGARSARLCFDLRSKGYEDVYSMLGGASGPTDVTTILTK